MDLKRVVGIVLIVLGILGLVYGGFSYTKEEPAANIGPVKIGVEKEKHVRVPAWAGVAALIAGVVLVAAGGKK